MKRALALWFTLALAPAPALAFDLGSALDGLASAICGLRNPGGGLGPISIAMPVQSMFDLQGFCRSYAVYKKSQNFGDILADAGRLALQNAFQGLIDGLAGALGRQLQSSFAPVNDFLRAFAQQANRFLNLPYLVADTIYDLTYSSAYREIYNSLTGQATRFQIAAPSGATAAISPVDPNLAAAYAYPDSAEVARMNAAIADESKSASSILSDAASIADHAAKVEEAKVRAEQVAQEVRESASREAIRQAISGQAETAKKVAEAAAQVTAQDPTNTNPGKAQKYRQEAENAPSDRALLELQVKALADIMEQQAVYMTYIADLLVQQSKLQAMTTQDLKEAARAAQAEREAAIAAAVSPDTIERYWQNALERAKADTEPMLALLTAACAFYSGGETQGCQ
jgi:hypothetical protein